MKTNFYPNLVLGIVIGLVIAGLVIFVFLPDREIDVPLSETVDKTSPVVVSIVASDKLEGLQKLFFSGDRNEGGTSDIGGGTGFLVREDGLIATADHIIEGESYTVILSDGTELVAIVAGQVPEKDIAFLDIEGDGYPVADLNSEGILPGDAVYAIGNSLGYYSQSILTGTVSHIDRFIENKGHGMEEVLQLHMSISEGDSGGAVFNESGKVIGMLIAFDNRGGAISFAAPVTQIEQAMIDLNL